MTTIETTWTTMWTPESEDHSEGGIGVLDHPGSDIEDETSTPWSEKTIVCGSGDDLDEDEAYFLDDDDDDDDGYDDDDDYDDDDFDDYDDELDNDDDVDDDEL